MVDFDHYCRRRHWSRKKLAEQERMIGKRPAPNREFHTMKLAVDVIRQVLPTRRKDGKESGS